MILSLFRRSRNDDIIDRLYTAVVEASRQRPLYALMGIPDTFEGRFESLTLHAALLVRRLRSAEAPGPDMAQHLVDTVFRHFDRTLREMGVGDTTVPKRMKQLAEAFLGRCTAYDEAIRTEDPGALEAALKRNVYMNEGGAAPLAAPLAGYVRASLEALASQPLGAYMKGSAPFPDPADFCAQVPT